MKLGKIISSPLGKYWIPAFSFVVALIIVFNLVDIGGEEEKTGETKPLSGRSSAASGRQAGTAAETTATNRQEVTVPEEKPGVFMTIMTIAGKSQVQVEALLGYPLSSAMVNPGGTNCPCPVNMYKGSIEIIYVNGVADWITINDTGDLLFSTESLVRLGLPAVEPTFAGPDTIRWNNVPGLRQVEFFPSGQQMLYVVIKTNTP